MDKRKQLSSKEVVDHMCKMQFIRKNHGIMFDIMKEGYWIFKYKSPIFNVNDIHPFYVPRASLDQFVDSIKVYTFADRCTRNTVCCLLIHQEDQLYYSTYDHDMFAFTI